MRIVISFVGAFVLFAGCTTIEPDVAFDNNVTHSYVQTSTSSRVIREGWWRDFGSQELNALVEKALENSPDILMAYERIEQAKISLASAGAEYFPSVDIKANTSASESKKSGSSSVSSENTSASIGISYELDVWGKIGASIRASKAAADMSVYDYEAVRLSLSASVAESYVRILSAKEKLSLAQENLKIMQDVLVILEKKRKLGTVSDVELSAQRASILAQKNSIAALKNSYENAKYALSLLVGESPSFFGMPSESIYDLSLPEVGAGLPSELLLKRPDIAAQKAALESHKALIQAADAARYPSFSLSASGGVASNELLSLSNPTSTLSAGLGLSYNLFDYGKLKNNVLIAESKANEALQNYRKTLLQAFGEVEEALSNLALAKEQATHTQNLVEELLFSLGLTDTRHKYGAVDFETLLNAQKSYISTKQQAIDTLEAKLTALVTLHKALGGGFKLGE